MSKKLIHHVTKTGIKSDPRVRGDDKGAPKNGRDMPQDFLLEIGCEELPSDYMPTVLDWDDKGPGLAGGLASSAASALDKDELVWKELQSFATPRRLVLVVRGVNPKVHKTEEGPPVSIAFDASGNPTDAAKGFAKKQGVSFSQLKRKNTPKGERLVLERSIPVEEVLAKAIPLIMQRIVFPKTMRWDNSGVRFARPVRWLLALYGPKVVPCTVGFLRSDRLTYGLRRGSGKPVRVVSAESYFSTLDRLHVNFEDGLIWKQTAKESPLHLQHKEIPHRKSEEIQKELAEVAKHLKGRLQDQNTEEFHWLLNTVTFLTEDPIVAVGSFQKIYLDLPPEVLATSMAKHLKLFGVYDAKGEKLLPQFLAVLEGKPAKPKMVMANIERILEARFADARFFYREDTKTPLKAKIPQLEKVVFHEKLGTVADRIPRLKRLMDCIAKQIHVPADVLMGRERIAELCKADLVTHMVREFPSLQGAVGCHYTRQDEELGPVSQAIGEQYKPKTASDSLPISPLGALISLADRLDILIGYFGVGLKPTGSVDPYGLRRQALGAVRILTEFTFQDKGNVITGEGLFFRGLSIDRLLDEGIQSWGSRLTVNPMVLKHELRAFLLERFEWFASVRGIDRDLTMAILLVASNRDDLASGWQRLKILQGLWGMAGKEPSSVLVKAAKVAERAGRMVQSVKDGDGVRQVQPELLKESSEKKLWESWSRISPVVAEQVRNQRYEEAVTTYASLYPEVHEFFQNVFVMDENLDLRRNRLAFMNQIYQALAGHFADLSKLPLAGLEPS